VKQWGDFLAICIERTGRIVVIPTKKDAFHLVGNQYDRIILGRNAHGAGMGVYRAVYLQVVNGCEVCTWVDQEVVDIANGSRSLE